MGMSYSVIDGLVIVSDLLPKYVTYNFPPHLISLVQCKALELKIC